MLCLDLKPEPLALPLNHPYEAITYLVRQRRVLEGQALDLNGDAARSFLLALRQGHFLVIISESLKVAIISPLPGYVPGAAAEVQGGLGDVVGITPAGRCYSRVPVEEVN